MEVSSGVGRSGVSCVTLSLCPTGTPVASANFSAPVPISLRELQGEVNVVNCLRDSSTACNSRPSCRSLGIQSGCLLTRHRNMSCSAISSGARWGKNHVGLHRPTEKQMDFCSRIYSERKFASLTAITAARDGNRKQMFQTRAYRGRAVGDLEWLSRADPYEVLGVPEDCSEEDIKSAFRARIKEYHPDVYQGVGDADAITQRLLRAYEILTNDVEREVYKRKSSDPFEEPECAAEDLFVNEVACIGRGCPYSCVERAPDVFQFASDTGCARASRQGKGGEYHVQLAVGQCPRNCIHYVTPAQRTLLEELLQSAIEGTVYSYEVVTMEGLIAKANFENGRYQPPKRKAKRTEQWVDWF